MTTVVLLFLSNIFMTVAWYGHLKFKHHSIWLVILASWGIAFFEYCLQVPANRLGHGRFSAAQLKIMQEVITLVVFVGFSILYLNEKPRWNEALGMLFILAAVVCVFAIKPSAPATPAATLTRAETPPLPLPLQQTPSSTQLPSPPQSPAAM